MIKSTVLVTAFLVVSGNRAWAEDAPPPTSDEVVFADWPSGWIAAYRRFENFLAVRRDIWPPAGLHLIRGAVFIHSVPDPTQGEKLAGLEIYQAGRKSLSTAYNSKSGRDLSAMGPGLFSVCAKSSTTFLGYQHHFPFVWWESVLKEETPGGTQSGRPEYTLRIVPAPGNGMEVWPNERLLTFQDFIAFTRYLNFQSPVTINRSVTLHCDPDGVVRRDLLPDAKTESLLTWRIYHDGLLLESGTAGGVEKHAMTAGPGNYLVLLGVDGPSGFIPVSNFLEFPLFPGGGGSLSIVPPDANSDGIPDFIEPMIAGGSARIFQIPKSRDTDGDGVADVKESGHHTIIEPSATVVQDESGRRLLQLWKQWEFALKHNPDQRRK